MRDLCFYSGYFSPYVWCFLMGRARLVGTGPGYTYRYIWFFSGYWMGLWVWMGTIDGCFGETAEVVDIIIVFEIFEWVLIIFTFWLTIEKSRSCACFPNR